MKRNSLKIPGLKRTGAAVLGLFLAFLQLSAESYGQRVTLNQENIPLKVVFQSIKKQTDYVFAYNTPAVEKVNVSISVKNASLEKTLKECLKGLPYTFKIMGKHVLIKESEQPAASALATVQEFDVSGRVTDGQGQPLPGVSVLVKGTETGTSTDQDGRFTLSAISEDAVLVFSLLGYEAREIAVAGQKEINLSLLEDLESLEEVVVVGYGTQRKVTLTGSVASIDNEEITTTKNENVQNMLTGKIPGVRVVQRTAEPGTFNNAFDIRGMGAPLIVIDGVPRTMADFQRLNADDIDNISVLKDASAAIYGVRSANGVVLVTTKKGGDRKSTLTYDGDFVWQFPSGLPKTVDIFQYMTLRNEQAMHNINGGSPIFSDEEFEAYRTGEKQSTDWNPLVFADYAPQTSHNLSAAGGNENIQYYVGAGYMNQGSFFQSDDLNYTRYNLRSNITAKIADRFTLDGGINLITETQNRPYVDSWWIIRGFWRQGPQIPAYANDDPTKPYHGLIEGDNPLSFMDKDLVGYRKFNNSWIQPTIGLRYDIPGIEGLYVRTLFSYDYSMDNRSYFQKEYEQYRYDESADAYSTFTRQSPDRITREAYFRSQLLSQTTLNYAGSFDRHQISGTLVWEAQKRKGDNLIAQRDLGLPLPWLFAGLPLGQVARMNTDDEDLYEDANMGLAGRINYSWSDKYLAEFLFRYDGSSKFASSYQWGFFPGGSVGWRISEEDFIKNSAALAFIDQLKLRASYGLTGDDGASTYQWIAGYNYPSSTSSRNFTGGYVFDGNFIASANSTGIANPNITWYTAETFDVGLDFEGWDGLLGVTVDYFNRKRKGLLALRSGGIPTVVGAALPQENLNSDMTFGYDLELSHRNEIGGFYYDLTGILSYTRVKALYVERETYGSSWSNWRNNQNNRFQGSWSNEENNWTSGVWWGFEGDGRYESWEDIWSSPVYVGRETLPGDYRYEDWNGDGEINDLDRHPFQLSSTPWLNFSLIGNVAFKGFDLNFLFQGSALSTVQYLEQLHQPLWGNSESAAMVQFMDRWHPEDPKADPYDPATKWIPGYYAYTGTLSDVNSSFNAVNGAYLRLKSIELGYSLPSKSVESLGIASARVYVNAYNLFTFTKVKYIDPEHPNDLWGYLYPLNKTVSAGINVTF